MNARAVLSDLVQSTKRGAWVVLALSGAFATTVHAQPAPTGSPGTVAPATTADSASSPTSSPSAGAPASTTSAPPGSASTSSSLASPDGAPTVRTDFAPIGMPDRPNEGSESKPSPVVQADDKGFSIAAPDRSYLLKMRGLMQADGRFFVDNDALAASDTFVVRKFRISMEGTLFSFVDMKLVPEFAGTVQMLDAYADLHPWDWLRLKVGKYKPPIGLERLQSDESRSFLEQSLVSNLSAQRDVGVSLWGDVGGGTVHYIVGVFNGAPDTTSNDTDTNRAKDVQGRVFLRPFHGDLEKSYGNLGVGFSVGTGNRKGKLPTTTAAATTGLSAFKTAGQNTFFQYLAPSSDTTGATTTFTHERATRLNPQLYYFFGPLGVMGEYMWLNQGVQKGNATRELKHQAASATLSFVINGKQGYEGPTPTVGFDLAKGTLGAFEIAARWSWIKLDDATFGEPGVAGSVQYASPTASAKEANGFGGVVTWVPRRSFHLSASFDRTEFKGGAGIASAPADRTAENVIIARAQVAF